MERLYLAPEEGRQKREREKTTGGAEREEEGKRGGWRVIVGKNGDNLLRGQVI